MIEELYKSRSVAGCISAATNYLFNNLKSISKQLWLPIVVFAVIMGLFQKLSIEVSISSSPVLSTMTLLLMLGLCSLALIASALWLTGAIIRIVNGKSLIRNIKRYIVLGLFGLALTLVVTLVVVGIFFLFRGDNSQVDVAQAFNNTLASIAICGAVLIAIVLLIIPFIQSEMKYLIEDVSITTAITKGYAEGFRHYGKLLLALILISLLVMVIILIVALPMQILLMAQSASWTGILMGDEASLPSHFGLLALVVSIIVYALGIAAVVIWEFLALSYVYGSIAHDEQEKANNALNSMNSL